MARAGRAGLAGVSLAAAAVGAAAGLAAERALVGRALRSRERPNQFRFGELRSPSQVVTTDDGVELYVEVSEPGAAPMWPGLTVVFVHGYALNMDCFHFQRQAVEGHARVVLYDQRSHGRSGRGPREHVTVARLGRDLRCVLDAVAPDGPVVLVGHSMGGMSVMSLAEHQPELFGDRVVGVALMSTSSGNLADVTLGVPAFAMRAVQRVAPRLVDAVGRNATLVERGRRVTSDLAALVAKVYAFSGQVPAELVDFSLEMINGTTVEVLADFYPVFSAHEAVESLAVLNGVETLVLVGEQDLLTPSDHSRRIVQVIPGAELVVLDPGGHLVMLERPDDVNSHLFDLLDAAQRHATAGAGA